MNFIDLNCDLGESFGNYTIGMDEEVIPFISSANVACGWHGGDPLVLEKTVGMCEKLGIAVGAHPGFPDLMGFGRRNMTVSTDEAYAYTKYQIGALYGFTKSKNIPLQHVKPHGAFYNMAGKDKNLALAICRGIHDFDPQLILLGLAGSCMIDAAKELGMRYAQEVFADRAYNDDGSLVGRNLPGAVIHDEALAIERVVKMVKENSVISITGKEISLTPHSICVHGDNPSAVAFVRSIRERLTAENITITDLDHVCK